MPKISMNLDKEKLQDKIKAQLNSDQTKITKTDFSLTKIFSHKYLKTKMPDCFSPRHMSFF